MDGKMLAFSMIGHARTWPQNEDLILDGSIQGIWELIFFSFFFFFKSASLSFFEAWAKKCKMEEDALKPIFQELEDF